MKVLVIGGGASGLVTAIAAAQKNCEVTILEKNSKCGKQLLLTGNGRCNYWNDNQKLDCYHSQNLGEFAKIWESKKEEVLPFFEEIGIVPKVINGYYYPWSNQANSILNALMTKIKTLKINIIYDEEVKEIEKKQKFVIKTLKNSYVADKVVLATGGCSFSKTGSDGKGLKIAQKLGHEIKDVSPSLVQLIGQDPFYKDWNGVRAYAKLSLFQDDCFIKEEAGEVQLTDYGLSGICAFNLSIYFDKTKNNEIKINFVPWFTGNKNEFKKWLKTQSQKLKMFSLGEMLEGFLNYKIVNLILKLTKLKDLNDEKSLDILTNYLFEFSVKIKDTKSFDYAQVTKGGVSLLDINPLTMESKKVKGLFLVGEILDVCGDCGGYNLAIAWMSGLLAGDGLTND